MEMPKFCGLSMYIEINVKNYSSIKFYICDFQDSLAINSWDQIDVAVWRHPATMR